MTIDPMAALSAVTDRASSALGIDQAASQEMASAAKNAPEAPIAHPPDADKGARADLFDYSAKKLNQPPAIDTLSSKSQANYLSNPAALGEKVLQQMEGLHQRSLAYNQQLQGTGSTGAPTISAGGETMAGPASKDVAGSSNAWQTTEYSSLKLMFDYAAETKLISMTSSQFVSAINTLLKGQ